MVPKTLHDLEFFSVLEKTCSYCLSEEGRQELNQVRFVYDEATLAREQDIIEDLEVLASVRTDTPFTFVSIDEAIIQLEKRERRLEGKHLYALACYLKAAQTFIRYCRDPVVGSDDGSHPAQSLFEPLCEKLHSLLVSLEDTLEEPGVVKPSHPAIRRLTEDLERKRAAREAFCASYIQAKEHAVQIDQPVLRDGRIVLAFRSDQKAGIEGFVHSVSATGATIYIEPYRLVELNNDVVLAQQQILVETARILAQLSQMAREQLDRLQQLRMQVGRADALYARSRYKAVYRCTRPQLSQDGRLVLHNARHPLLGEQAVPISLEIGPSIKAVVISGPNAGGKTVTIKTVGLFVLMHQFLYVVPADSSTVLPLFHNVYTDIGDEQSIEASLSTFSAHMKNIAKILQACDQHTLLILDELASQTDPLEGSALAHAILEYCINKAALTLVTSHFLVLKQIGYAKPQVLNAAMEFDEQTHEPTFRIISGIPGESHALDTARRMEMPQEVLKAAMEYIGPEKIEISSIIEELEHQRRELTQKQEELAKRERHLQEKTRSIDLYELQLKQKEYVLRSGQIADLSRFIEEKRKELENLIASLREGEITREKTRRTKQFIASLEKQKEESLQEAQEIADVIAGKEKGRSKDIGELFEGMEVLVGEQKREGRIVRKEKDGTYLVSIGQVKLHVKREELAPRAVHGTKKPTVLYDAPSVVLRSVIDVRGMTLEDALDAVARQIESALVHGAGSLVIIHGTGEGILSCGIHQYLQTLPTIVKFYFARPEDGGQGKTYVEFDKSPHEC